MKRILILFSALSAGCTLLPHKLKNATAGQIILAPTQELCELYRKHSDPRVKDELQRRAKTEDYKLPKLKLDEVDTALAGNIYVGMSEAGLYCAWGKPNLLTGGDQFRTSSRYGTRKTLIYRYSPYSSADYVTIEDGEIIYISGR